MKGYDIKKVYVIICDRCGMDITRSLDGGEPETRAAAEEWAREHEESWHT